MSRTAVLTDEMWAQIEPLLPPLKGPMGRPRAPYRPLVEGAIYRLRTGGGLAGPASGVRPVAGRDGKASRQPDRRRRRRRRFCAPSASVPDKQVALARAAA